MKIRCAWCGKYMGEKDGEGIEGISHSVCEDCYKILTQEEDAKTNKTITVHSGKVSSEGFISSDKQ